MTLDFVSRGVVQMLAAYALVSTLGAIVLALAWTRLVTRTASSPLHQAARLFMCRLLPGLAAVAIAFVAVPAAYFLWEPRAADEPVGPVALALASAGAAVLAAALLRLVLAVRQTRLIAARLRLAAAGYRAVRPGERRHAPARFDTQPLDEATVPAVPIDSAFPIVALVGVWRPTLFIAGAVLDACTARELRAVVAHEVAHARAGDNLRRALLRGAPDVLGWCGIGTRMERDWAAAAELAADEAGVAGHVEDRLHLASALVKVARLATTPPPFPVPASALYVGDPIEDRVRRLVEWPPAGPEGASTRRFPAWLLLGAGLLATPLALPALYAALETLVALGR
jgi:Zn-dependent protease with chaperone function